MPIATLEAELAVVVVVVVGVVMVYVLGRHVPAMVILE